MYLYHLIGYGQLMTNGDFSNNSGNTLYECANNSATGTVIQILPNWYTTHGTPRFFSTDPDAIYMEDIGRRGEGIIGSYPFKQGVTYTIHLGVSSVTNPGNIVMVAGNGSWPFDGNCYNYCNGGSNEFHGKSPITFSPSAKQEWVLNPLGGVGLSTVVVGDNAFTFTPTKRDQDWITLYPFDIQAIGCETSSITVDYIWINRDCKGDKYISEFPNSSIYYNTEPYMCYQYEHIYAGSKFGSSSIANTNGQTAQLYASKSVLLENNIIIAPTTGNHFLANIDKTSCSYFPNNLDNGSASKGFASDDLKIDTAILNATERAMQELNNVQNTAFNFDVYPNPTTGSFTIQLPIAEDCEVRITNIMGATVYQSSMKGEQKKQIQLDGGLPAGNYTLQLRGKTINHIEKLVLTK